MPPSICQKQTFRRDRPLADVGVLVRRSLSEFVQVLLARRGGALYPSPDAEPELPGHRHSIRPLHQIRAAVLIRVTGDGIQRPYSVVGDNHARMRLSAVRSFRVKLVCAIGRDFPDPSAWIYRHFPGADHRRIDFPAGDVRGQGKRRGCPRIVAGASRHKKSAVIAVTSAQRLSPRCDARRLILLRGQIASGQLRDTEACRGGGQKIALPVPVVRCALRAGAILGIFRGRLARHGAVCAFIEAKSETRELTRRLLARLADCVAGPGFPAPRWLRSPG